MAARIETKASRLFFPLAKDTMRLLSFMRKDGENALNLQMQLKDNLKTSDDKARNSNSDHNVSDFVVVDLALLVPVLYLSEALVQDYRLKKALVKLLDHIVSQKKPRIGKEDLLSWLRKTGFGHTEAIEKLLRTTPLGNPAWQLFGQGTEKLLEDLDAYIDRTSSLVPRSLKSLMGDFITEHPEYGVVPKDYDPTKWTTFFTPGYGWPLGDVVTKLMMLQTAASPKTIAQQKLAGVTPVKDSFPIHRPDYAYYGIALRDLMIGSAKVSKDAWDEMVSLYMSRTLTNFLAFAPLLMQPFVKSDLNIPAPTLNTLATLMGDFTGATGTFMGEITKAKTPVRWESLGLTIGKLCEKKGKLSPVTEATPSQEAELSLALKNTTRICGSAITETPTIGDDRGWILIGEELLEDRWNIKLPDINSSIITDKIQFNKFPTKLIGTLVFTTPWSLTCLNQWSRKQVKQSVVLRLLGDSGVWFNKLPSAYTPVVASAPTKGVAENSPTAFPILTSAFRSEKKSLNRVRKFLAKAGEPVEPTSASRDAEKTKMFPSSDIKASSTNVIETLNTSMRLDVVRPLLKEGTGATNLPDDDGISNFFIAETYQGEQYRKTCISKVRQQKIIKLIAERKEQDAYRFLSQMSDDELKTEITTRLERFKTIEVTKKMPKKEKDLIRGELEISFAELCERDLGISFPNLVGLRQEASPKDQASPTKDRDLHFRYRLGDEEAIAVEAWYNEESKDDQEPAVPTTKAVQRVKAALTFIYLAKHLKSCGEKWSFKRLWEFDLFKKYPLAEADRHAVFSMIPHLYWVHELEQPDMFRIKTPDMSTVLFVPTARISSNLDGDIYADDDDESPTPIVLPTDAYLPEPLADVRVSSLSLCSLAEWSPQMLLVNASNFFGLKSYSLDLHPTETQFVRLYVKKAVESVLHRLSNPNLADTLSSVSSIPMQMSPSVVRTIVGSLREQLKTWYEEFHSSFNDKWKMIGDEWVAFVDVSEIEKDTRYV